MTIAEIDCAVVAAGVLVSSLTILADWNLISPKDAVDQDGLSGEIDQPGRIESIKSGPHTHVHPAQGISAPTRIAATAETPDEVVGILTFVEVLNQLRVREGQDRPSNVRYAFYELRA